jgi:hypothetical protein
MNQKIIFRTGILVAIVAMTIGVFAWKVYQLSQFSYSPAVTKKSIKKQSVVENKVDETADWQTYRNEKYGFEVQMPNKWKTEELAGQDGQFDFKVSFFERNSEIETPGVNVVIRKNSVKNLDNFVEQEIASSVASFKEAYSIDIASKDIVRKEEKIGNVRGVRIVYGGAGATTVAFIKGDNIFTITNSFREDDAIFEKIISTFKFTDDTSIWQTYRNEKYGFEFQYPKKWFIDDSGLLSESVRFYLVLSTYENARSFNLGNAPVDLETIFFGITAVDPKMTLDELKPVSNEVPAIQFKKITTKYNLEGRRVVFYSNDHPVGNHTSAFFINAGNKFEFNLGTGSEDQSGLFDKILSTFRFVN